MKFYYRKYKGQEIQIAIFSHERKYLHSVKSVDTLAIGTFISGSLAKCPLTRLLPFYHLKCTDIVVKESSELYNGKKYLKIRN